MGYKAVKRDGKKVDLHRYIMQQEYNNTLGYNDVVHFIDGDKSNISKDNLEVISRSENTRRFMTGKCKSLEHKQKLSISNKNNLPANAKTVAQYSLDNEYLGFYCSAREAARELGDEKMNTHITACCQGKRRTAYGYIWRWE